MLNPPEIRGDRSRKERRGSALICGVVRSVKLDLRTRNRLLATMNVAADVRQVRRHGGWRQDGATGQHRRLRETGDSNASGLPWGPR